MRQDDVVAEIARMLGKKPRMSVTVVKDGEVVNIDARIQFQTVLLVAQAEAYYEDWDGTPDDEFSIWCDVIPGLLTTMARTAGILSETEEYGLVRKVGSEEEGVDSSLVDVLKYDSVKLAAAMSGEGVEFSGIDVGKDTELVSCYAIDAARLDVLDEESEYVATFEIPTTGYLGWKDVIERVGTRIFGWM